MTCPLTTSRACVSTTPCPGTSRTVKGACVVWPEAATANVSTKRDKSMSKSATRTRQAPVVIRRPEGSVPGGKREYVYHEMYERIGRVLMHAPHNGDVEVTCNLAPDGTAGHWSGPVYWFGDRIRTAQKTDFQRIFGEVWYVYWEDSTGSVQP